MPFVERYGPWRLSPAASSGIGGNCDTAGGARSQRAHSRKAQDRLERLAAELVAKCGVQVEVLELDLAAADFLQTLLNATQQDVGLVISNAGFGLKGLHHLQDRGQLDSMLNVNARAPTLITRHSRRAHQRGTAGCYHRLGGRLHELPMVGHLCRYQGVCSLAGRGTLG